MSEIHVVVGASLLSFGAATGAYLGHKLFDTQKYQRSNSGSIIILLSETLIATIIGILHIYCYSCECSEETFTEINEIFNQTIRQDENAAVENCETSVECMYRKMLIEQLVLTIAAIHSFISLVTSTSLCKKMDGDCSTIEEPSTSSSGKPRQLDTTNIQTVIVSIVAQWILPIIGAVVLCYVMNMPDGRSMCEITNTVSRVPENFQNLVSELLDKPINVTEKSVYKTEIDNIIGKVYSIVESATQPSDINKVTDLDEGFQILNIIERLNTHNYRTPKQMKFDFSFNDISFKIYTILFLLFGFLGPMVYSTSAHTKLKMILQMGQETRKDSNTQINLQEKVKYLKMSIIAAGALWTPSITETFSRTFITQSQPNVTMHILMAIGSSYMLLRYGINLKLLKSFIGQQNSVVPKA